MPAKKNRAAVRTGSNQPDSQSPDQEPAPVVANPPALSATQVVLQKRRAPLNRALARWGSLSLIPQALVLRDVSTPEAAVTSLGNLIYTLRAARCEDIFDRLHADSEFLPLTWQVISQIRAGCSCDDAVAVVMAEVGGPDWKPIWEELSAYLWMRVQNSVPSRAEIDAAAYQFHDEALRLEAGVLPAVTAEPPTSSGSTSMNAACSADKAPAVASDFSWIRCEGEMYPFHTPQQIGAIKLLWEAWEDAGQMDGFGLHQEDIAERLDASSARFRIDHVFRGHAALHRILRPSSRGRWALYLNSGQPSAAESPKNHQS